MISIKNPMTAQVPSASGMPISGHAVGSTVRCATAPTTAVVRDRKAITGADLGLVQGYFPGTSAWRPPTC